jgi:hypothetical protein
VQPHGLGSQLQLTASGEPLGPAWTAATRTKAIEKIDAINFMVVWLWWRFLGERRLWECFFLCIHTTYIEGCAFHIGNREAWVSFYIQDYGATTHPFHMEHWNGSLYRCFSLRYSSAEAGLVNWNGDVSTWQSDRYWRRQSRNCVVLLHDPSLFAIGQSASVHQLFLTPISDNRKVCRPWNTRYIVWKQ